MTDTDGDLGNDANLNQGDSDGSNDSTGLETLLKRLDVLESQQKSLQSDKDRGVNKVQKENRKLQNQFAEMQSYVEKYGEDAERQWDLDQTLQRLNTLAEQFESARQEDASAKQKPAAETVDPELLKKYGVDPQSAEYLAHVKAGLTGFEAVLATATGAKPPVQREGDATGASGGAGGAGSPTTAQAVLKSQYEAALDKAQKEYGFLTPDQLQSIDDDFRKRGLDI
jgi:hypothetical protein